ncbi:Ger(x)C family spore germination protein [Cytobacillus gottheilii]|uniref:Ger(x)C family spore germination protein n=1 Tax=Cytobacillus gottheilii TaxID=859144 RepID=UPI0015937873|nr:Ger(x)C family spore germination protein [Cytobacillus gottheilii]
MKTKRYLLLSFCISTLLLSGCNDKTNIEDITMTLMLGIDLNEDNEMIIYSSNPVFDKEVSDKNEEYSVKASSLREGRGELDSLLAGTISKGKMQVLLIGKKVIQHEDWFELLDSLYRDSFSSINCKVIIVEESVADVIYSSPSDKIRLPLHISKLVETGDKRHITRETTLHDVQSDHYSKTKTGSIPRITYKNNSINLSGFTLLNHKDMYVSDINQYEGELLQLLSNTKLDQLFLTTKLSKEETNPFQSKLLSYNVGDLNRKIKVKYENDQFVFETDYSLAIYIKEALNENPYKDREKIEKELKEKLTADFNKLVKSFQDNGIDPVGFGEYARAFQNKHWEKVSDNWGDAFGKSNITIDVSVRIKDEGLNMR